MENTRRQPLRQDSPRRIASVEIPIMLIIWPINYSTIMVCSMFYQWIDMCMKNASLDIFIAIRKKRLPD